MNKLCFGINNILCKFTLTIMVLVFCFSVLPVLAVENEQTSNQQTSATQTIKYPPYPDVWDWQVPNQTSYIQGSLFAYPLSNGDVLIIYSEWGKDDSKDSLSEEKSTDTHKQKEAISKQVTFFGKQRVLNEPSNVKLIRSPEKELKLEDGTIVKRLTSDFADKHSVEFSDKTYIISRYERFKDCYIGPASNWLARYKNKGLPPRYILAEPAASKVIFLLPDKPIRWQGGYHEECEEADHILSIKVQAIGGSILSLPDDTFLLIDSAKGIIVRLKKDLTTETPLLGKKLFVLDFANTDFDYTFISKHNGKSYKNKQGKLMMQEVLDDLYSYLMQLRKGAK
jgi:hypothetical protein